MKKEDIKVGMKVKVLGKSLGYPLDEFKFKCSTKYDYYVVKYMEDPAGIRISAEDSKSTFAYFAPEDLEPYETIPKFKVGDRVKVLTPDNDSIAYRLYGGNEYVIEGYIYNRADFFVGYQLNAFGMGYLFEDQLEPVTEEPKVEIDYLKPRYNTEEFKEYFTNLINKNGRSYGLVRKCFLDDLILSEKELIRISKEAMEIFDIQTPSKRWWWKE